MARKSKKTVAPHSSVRRCKICGVYHTPTQHKSHGIGSAARKIKAAASKLRDKYRVDYPKGKARKRAVPKPKYASGRR